LKPQRHKGHKDGKSVEARLDAIEADPAFQAMADRSDKDFRQKRFVSHADLRRQVLARRKEPSA